MSDQINNNVQVHNGLEIEVKYQVWDSSTNANSTLSKLAREFTKITLHSCECHDQLCEDGLTLLMDDLLVEHGKYLTMTINGDPLITERPKTRFARLDNVTVYTLELWHNTVTVLDKISEIDMLRVHGTVIVKHAHVNNLIAIGVAQLRSDAYVEEAEVYGDLYVDDPKSIGDITIYPGGKVYIARDAEDKIFSDRRDLYYNETQGYFAG